MPKRKVPVGATRKNIAPTWWQAMPLERRGHVLRFVAVCAAWLGACAGAVYGMIRLKDSSLRDAVFQGAPQFMLPDCPSDYQSIILGRLAEQIHLSWGHPDICRTVAEEVSRSDWVAEVRSVRRRRDRTLEIDCRYRIPVALVFHDQGYYLVDEEGVELPGSYRYEPGWIMIRGVSAPPPGSGRTWEGKDLAAGLDMVRLLGRRPFAHQVVAVLVENYGGRVSPRESHIEVVTDWQASRILWGSAPGEELEENSASQKLRILENNYSQYGRIDADQPKIDVSVFEDRFTVPRH